MDISDRGNSLSQDFVYLLTYCILWHIGIIVLRVILVGIIIDFLAWDLSDCWGIRDSL